MLPPNLDLIVSSNDANLKNWTNGSDGPTNEALKRSLAAVRK